MEENKEEIEVQLYSSSNQYIINQICNILKENNIPFFTKYDGTGSYMKLHFGQSFSYQEQRIFINKNDYNKSMELISPFISDNIEKSKTKENNKSRKKYKLISRILIWTFLIVSLIAVILEIIFYLFLE